MRAVGVFIFFSIVIAILLEEQQTEIYLNFMCSVSQNPAISTRQIAEEVGSSNDSTYYVLIILVEKSFVTI